MHTSPLHKEGGPCHLGRPAHLCGPTTFLSTQVDVQWCDHLPAQGLPPPHDHVDGALPMEEGLEGLLFVLVDEVHVIDSQQPVVDPEEGHSQVSALAGLGTSGQAASLQSGKTRAGSGCPTYTLRQISSSECQMATLAEAGARLPGGSLALLLTSCVTSLLQTSVSSSVKWGQEQ